jgi:hypothetical protein
MVKRLAIAVLLFLIPALAKADSVWTYQGNATLTNGMLGESSEGFAITGTVLLGNNDQVLGWNFVVGPITFTTQNSTTFGSFNIFAGNSSQPFVFWNIQLVIPAPPSNPDGGAGMTSINAPGFEVIDQASDHDGAFLVDTTDNPGRWTEVIATPEPSTLILLLATFTVFAFVRSRSSGESLSTSF